MEPSLSSPTSTSVPIHVEERGPNNSMGASHSTPPPPVPLLNHGDGDGDGDIEEQRNATSEHGNGNGNGNGNAQKKLGLLSLIFLIYFEVSGGPYGEESAVGAAGPLFAILGFLIFPFIWSIPEALITAELATTFPGNGGFVIWAREAFGPLPGSMMGTWKLFSGVINLASYPVMCVDYLKLIFPILSRGYPRYVAIYALTICMSFLNYIGLAIVGYVGICIGLLSLSPFVAMTGFSILKIKPSRWLSKGSPKKNWPLYFNTLFWNLNFWDNASTLAGEVENPQKTFPKALFSAGILTCLAYLIPLMAATGATPLNQSDWTEGYFADLAEMIGGPWLKYWTDIGSVLSVVGLYEAQLSSCAYQILGMSDIGVLPKGFGRKSSRFNTPLYGILLPTLVAMGVCLLEFTQIISAVNLLYSLGMLLEFASFLHLRKKMANLWRPFKVPLKLPGLIVLCLVPSVFLVYVLFVGTPVVYLISGSVSLAGIAWYFLMEFFRSKQLFEFNVYRDHKEQS